MKISVALAALGLWVSCASPTPPGAPMSAPSKKRTNRLANEKSPYLQQHKHNPVDWYPWGDEAF